MNHFSLSFLSLKRAFWGSMCTKKIHRTVLANSSLFSCVFLTNSSLFLCVSLKQMFFTCIFGGSSVVFDQAKKGGVYYDKYGIYYIWVIVLLLPYARCERRVTSQTRSTALSRGCHRALGKWSCLDDLTMCSLTGMWTSSSEAAVSLLCLINCILGYHRLPLKSCLYQLDKINVNF